MVFLRDFAQQLRDFVLRRRARKIRLRDDAGTTAAIVHDRYASDLIFLHRGDDFVDGRILPNRDDRLCHACLGRVTDWIFAVRDHAADDVTIGDYADDTVTAVDDGNFSTIVL